MSELPIGFTKVEYAGNNLYRIVRLFRASWIRRLFGVKTHWCILCQDGIFCTSWSPRWAATGQVCFASHEAGMAYVQVMLNREAQSANRHHR